MPCRSDYMDPTDKERLLQDPAKLLVYVNQKLGKTVSQVLKRAAADTYCDKDFVPTLCKTIKSMDEKTKDSIVYNGKDKMSRQLADWWEEHEEADREREKEETRKENHKKMVDRILKGLTKEQLEAISAHFYREWMKF